MDVTNLSFVDPLRLRDCGESFSSGSEFRQRRLLTFIVALHHSDSIKAVHTRDCSSSRPLRRRETAPFTLLESSNPALAI